MLKRHSISDDATLFRRCMLVGVLSRIWLFTDTYFVSQMTLMFLICFFPSSIIITFAAILHVFFRYTLYLLLLQCLYPGVNKELLCLVLHVYHSAYILHNMQL